MAEPAGKVRRIVDLEVKEVSLVDRPAIRRTFLVIKRLEEKTMGAFANDLEEKVQKAKKDAEDAEAEKAGKPKAGAEMTPEEKADAAAEEEEEKKKAGMPPKALAAMIRGIKGAPKGAVDELTTFLEEKAKAAKGDEDEEAAKAGPGAEGAPANPDEEYPSPNSKGKKAKSEGNLLVVKADGSIELDTAAISKGRKMFTEQRVSAIKETFLNLARVLQDADENAAKEAFAAIKELPTSVAMASEVRPAGAGKVQKDLENEVAELTKRLATIEKARNPSKATGPEGTDQPKEVKKSLWSGVL